MQEEDNGGYVFISHSHDDIKKVRIMRNKLEDEDFEPLCFYLKCLKDKDEIEDLIKREIDAREWFVFVNSPNSRASKWVQLERDYINEIGKKRVVNIDLESNISIKEITDIIIKELRVHIINAPHDDDFACRLKEKLIEKEFQATFSGQFYDDPWMRDLAESILQASKTGTVVPILSESSKNSMFFLKEIRFAKKNNAKFVSINIDDCDISDVELIIDSEWDRRKLKSVLGDIQFEKDVDLDEVAEKIGNLVEISINEKLKELGM